MIKDDDAFLARHGGKTLQLVDQLGFIVGIIKFYIWQAFDQIVPVDQIRHRRYLAIARLD